MGDLREKAEGDSNDLFKFITSLCQSIYRDESKPSIEYRELEKKYISKMRSRSFEILLKKSPLSSETVETKRGDSIFNPEQALEQYFFIKKLSCRRERSKLRMCIQNEKACERMSFDHPRMSQMLEFMLKLVAKDLQGNFFDQDDDYVTLVPGPFTLHAINPTDISNIVRTGTIDLKDFKPQFFKSIEMANVEQNDFVPKIWRSRNLEKLSQIEDKYGGFFSFPEISKNSCSFTGLTSRLCGGDMGFNLDETRALPEENISLGNSCGEPITKQPTPRNGIFYEESLEETDDEDYFDSWNWESLGRRGIKKQKPFISEYPSTTFLHRYLLDDPNEPFEVKLLSLKKFIRDIKLLTVGISSETFELNGNGSFTILKDAVVENYLPETINDYASTFIACGSCYKSLQALITKRGHSSYEGFMFKTLCDAIDEYLVNFREYIFSVEDDSLLSYYNRVNHLLKQIENLSSVLGVHPENNPNVGPPLGANFLSYIYKEIIRTTDDEYLNLMIYILKRCCYVYFKHLHKWIFYGRLDDTFNELFIGHVAHYRYNTRYYYERSYFVRKNSVPGFIQQYDSQVLLCGKYTMLLKSCRPNHPLFNLECPEIKVCLSYHDLEALKVETKQYHEAARKIFGAPFKISNIFEERSKRIEKFKEKLQQRTKENMILWKEEQQKASLQSAENKQAFFEELRIQMEEAKQRRIDKRKAEIVKDLEHIRLAEEHETKLLEFEQEQLKKRVEYYQELKDTIDSKSILDEKPKLDLDVTKTAVVPQEDILSKTPSTPAESVDDNSFASCCDKVADGNSDYADCLSLISNDSNKIVDDAAIQTFPSKESITETEAVDKPPSEAIGLKTSEMDQNRQKMLSGALFESCFYDNPEKVVTSVKKHLAVVAHAKSFPDINSNLEEKRAPTDLQTNRKKMLQSKIVSFDDEIVQRSFDILNCNEAPETSETINILDLKAENQNEVNLILPLASDLNSNIEKDVLDGLSEAQKNRKKIMESDLFSQLEQDPVKDRAELRLNLNTERARNRMKVLNSEFDIAVPLVDDSATNPPCTDRKTDSALNRNKQKVLNSEFDILSQQSVVINNKRKSSSTLNTERERNRLKVLGSEFDIWLNQDSNKSEVTAITPMSTTSDTPLHEVCSDASLQLDYENGNFSEKTSNLTLDIESTRTFIADGNIDSCCPSATSCTNETPSHALNTAGIRARQGFPFDEELERRKKQEEILKIIDKKPQIQEDDFYRNYIGLSSYVPYQRTSEILSSNFQCQPSSPFMRLNRLDPYLIAMNEEDEYEQYVNSEKTISPFNITQFLQQSVVLPVKAHLNLVQNEVMRLFFEEYHLLEHLRNLKNYFFLMDGEFGAKICDGILYRLESGCTPAQLFNYQTLHSILDYALGGFNIAGKQKNSSGHLSFIINDVPESFELSSPHCLNRLNLTYQVQWPLNIILSPEALEKYANVFKFLLSVHRMGFILDRSYEHLRDNLHKHGKNLLISPQYIHIQQIRHKLQIFVKALQNHVTASAIQASWDTFKKQLIKARSVEEVYNQHTAYIKRVTFLCMLNRRSKEFFTTFEKIFRIIIRFYKNLKMKSFKQRQGDTHFTHERYQRLIKDEQDFERCVNFMVYLGKKIVRRGYQHEIGQLIDLININGYYSPSAVKEIKENKPLGKPIPKPNLKSL